MKKKKKLQKENYWQTWQQNTLKRTNKEEAFSSVCDIIEKFFRE